MIITFDSDNLESSVAYRWKALSLLFRPRSFLIIFVIIFVSLCQIFWTVCRREPKPTQHSLKTTWKELELAADRVDEEIPLASKRILCCLCLRSCLSCRLSPQRKRVNRDKQQPSTAVDRCDAEGCEWRRCSQRRWRLEHRRATWTETENASQTLE